MKQMQVYCKDDRFFTREFFFPMFINKESKLPSNISKF